MDPEQITALLEQTSAEPSVLAPATAPGQDSRS
jgi:hypothetical protein